MKNMNPTLNPVQNAALDLIRSDAGLIHSLVTLSTHATLETNFIMMSQPYIGLFADGAEQWCRKVGVGAPTFHGLEKEYYTKMRLSHKMFEMNYPELVSLLMTQLNRDDQYYQLKAGMAGRILGYRNVGVDLYDNEFCGNTVLCNAYNPLDLLTNPSSGEEVKNMSIIVGRIAAFLGCVSFKPYRFRNEMFKARTKDYHFFEDCPLKIKTDWGFVLFSVLCSINYVIVFLENLFVDEIPQKFKYAYLQYYYLCGLIKSPELSKAVHLEMDVSMRNKDFRNCLSHYGLGQYMKDEDIIDNDLLKGLTQRSFSMGYYEAKETIYKTLIGLTTQIKEIIL